MTHHPHVHMIVPGGGISLDGERWIACRPGFFLPVRVLSRLFRRLFLEKLIAAHEAGRLKFFGDHAALADAQAFAAYLAPLRRSEWVVYAKRPFGGPQAVLAYLSRYTHRVAISNSRLIACDGNSVTFRWKDYRVEGRERQKVMTLATDEFIRRFLIHVLPHGFHRIRHYGLLASGTRADNIARARELLAVANSRGRAHRCRRRSRQADLSLLRRSHDHHRDLRARCYATASSDSSTHRQSGSTPHDRAPANPIVSLAGSRPATAERAQPSSVVSNRPTIRRDRRDPPLIQQPFHRPPACWSASTSFTHLIRGTQIPIAPRRATHVPLPAVSSLGGLRTPAPVRAAPPSWGRHPKTFTLADMRRASVSTSIRTRFSADRRRPRRWPIAQGREMSSGCTFSPPAIKGFHGSKRSRTSRFLTSERATTKASVAALSVPAATWAERLPEGIPRLEAHLQVIKGPIEALQKVIQQAEQVADAPPSQGSIVSVRRDLGLTGALFAGTRSVLDGLFTTVLVLYFLLVAGDIFLRRIVEILPTFSNKRQAVDISQQIQEDISAYLVTITAMNAAVGVTTAAAMYLCGLGDPLLWGAIAFLLNYIPILGPLFGIGIFVLVGMLSFESLWWALLPPALYFGIHLVEGETLTPMLLARRFTLNPVLIILSLVFWFWMWGVPGAILAVPMLAILKIISDRLRPLKALGHFLEG